jgi:hypothetical protein
MVKHLVSLIGMEDVILFLGALLASVGAALEFGVPIGLMVAGGLCLAYGAWVARGTNPTEQGGSD